MLQLWAPRARMKLGCSACRWVGCLQEEARRARHKPGWVVIMTPRMGLSERCASCTVFVPRDGIFAVRGCAKTVMTCRRSAVATPCNSYLMLWAPESQMGSHGSGWLQGMECPVQNVSGRLPDQLASTQPPVRRPQMAPPIRRLAVDMPHRHEHRAHA